MSDCFGWKMPARALAAENLVESLRLSNRLFNNGPNQKIHSVGRCAGCKRVGYTTLKGHPFRHKGPERAPQRLETVSYPHPGWAAREHPGDGRIIWPRGPYEATLRSEYRLRVPITMQSVTTTNDGDNYTNSIRIRYHNTPVLQTGAIGDFMAIDSADLWQFWLGGTPITSPTSAMTVTLPDLTWNTWTGSLTTSNSYTVLPETVWTGFVTDPQPMYRAAYARPRETEEEIRARLQAQQERLLRAQQREEDNRRMIEQRRAAAQVAEQTLLSLLSREQIEEYRKSRSFTVAGSRGSRFRIKHGTSGNVVRLDNRGQEVAGYCAHPELTIRGDGGEQLGWLPTEDVMLHQMLAISADEEGFLAVANRHWGGAR